MEDGILWTDQDVGDAGSATMHDGASGVPYSSLQRTAMTSLMTLLSLAVPYSMYRLSWFRSRLLVFLLVLCGLFWHKLLTEALYENSALGQLWAAVRPAIGSLVQHTVGFFVTNIIRPIILSVLALLKSLSSYAFDCVIWTISKLVQ